MVEHKEITNKAKINKNQVEFFILLVLMHNIGQLIAIDQPVIGPIKYHDVILLYCIYYFLKNYIQYPADFFSGLCRKEAFFIPVMVVTSAVAAFFFYDQNILSGVLTQRAFLIIFFMIFPIRAQIKHNILTFEVILKIVSLVATLEATLLLIQYFLGENYYFLAVSYTMRYGSIRILITTIYMYIAAMYALIHLLKKENMLQYCMILLVITAYIFLVNKGRQVYVEYVFILGIVFLFSEAQLKVKLVLGAIGAIFGGGYVLQSGVMQDLINIFVNGGYDQNLSYRLNAQSFYITTLNENPMAWLFGYGMGNSTLENSQIATGATQGFLLADNGIFGFLFSYGLVGLAWYASILFKEFALIKSMRKNKYVIIPFALLLNNMLFIATYKGFYYSVHCFTGVLILTLLEAIHYESQKSKAD